MKIDKLKYVYFLGIAGIGMSSLARYFHSKGFWVGGYDRNQSPLSLELEKEGIEIIYAEEVESLPDFLREPREENLIIHTPAIPSQNLLKRFFLEKGFQLYKRSQVLGEVCKSYKVIAVAGTHGKTTTCSMISYVLKSGGLDITAFLGGISTNFNTNYLKGQSDWAVVEADEYDRSFLTLYPELAIITSMDADHLDIYGTLENMFIAFNQFSQQIRERGQLIAKIGLPLEKSRFSYGIGKETGADIYAERIRISEGKYWFDYHEGSQIIPDFQLEIPGNHNIENALATIKIALILGLKPSLIRENLSQFKGVKRRFEYIFKSSHTLFIDDYAHHQDELKAFLETIRSLYPDKKITAIFQPHLFSRTRDFYHEMANSLSLVNELWLMEIYPAREEPIEGISSKILFDQVKLENKFILDRKEILSRIEKDPKEIILTIGAGSIDQLVEPIREILEKREKAIQENSEKGRKEGKENAG